MSIDFLIKVQTSYLLISRKPYDPYIKTWIDPELILVPSFTIVLLRFIEPENPCIIGTPADADTLITIIDRKQHFHRRRVRVFV